MSAVADDLKNSSNDARASARNFSESSPTLGCDKSAPEAARFSRVRLRARRRVVDFGGPSPMSEFSSPLRKPTRWKAKEYGDPATGSSIRLLNGNNLTVTLSKNLALFLTHR